MASRATATNCASCGAAAGALAVLGVAAAGGAGAGGAGVGGAAMTEPAPAFEMPDPPPESHVEQEFDGEHLSIRGGYFAAER